MDHRERDDAPGQPMQPRRIGNPAHTDTAMIVDGRSGENSLGIWPMRSRNAEGNRASDEGQVNESESANSDNASTGPFMRQGQGQWMTGKKMSLGEVYNLMDDNGGFRPKTAPPVGLNALGMSALGESDKTLATRSRSVEINAKISPSQIIKEKFAQAEREEDARLVPALEERTPTVAPIEYESESSAGQRDGSPSPAARQRPQWRKEHRSNNSAPPLLKVKPEDLEKSFTRHQRDRAKKERMLANTAPIFVRKDVGQRVAQTTRTLVRKTSGNDMAADRQRSSISGFDDEPEPPLKIPQQWGRRARQHPGWMQRILSPDEPTDIKDTVASIHAEYEQSFAANIPLPSVELSSEPTPPSSQPNSANPNSDKDNQSSMHQPWDTDIDLTTESLPTTSPVLRVCRTKLDDIREWEIQSLAPRALATDKLEEIRERNSEERTFSASFLHDNLQEQTPHLSKKLVEQMEQVGYQQPGTPVTVLLGGKSYKPADRITNFVPRHKRDDSRETLRKLSRILSKSPPPNRTEYEDLRVGKEMPQIKTGPETPSLLEKASLEDMVKPEEAEKAKPIERDRSLSDERTKRLPPRSQEIIGKITDAGRDRALSDGLLPDEIMDKAVNVVEKPEKSIARVKGLEVFNPEIKRASGASSPLKGVGFDFENKRPSRSSSPPKSDIDPEERITAEAKLFELLPADNRSEKNSVRAHSPSPLPSDDEGKYDETLRPKGNIFTLSTPKITGAYVETPTPSTRKIRKQRSMPTCYEIDEHAEVGGNTARGTLRRHSASTGSRVHTSDLRRPRPLQLQTQTSSSGTSCQREAEISRGQPRLINTARRVTVAEDLRRIKMEENIEDSDVDMILEDAANAVVSDLINVEPIVDLEHHERGLPLSQVERERQLEVLLMQRMNRRLRNASHSIHDARQGIERLERQVSISSPMPAKVREHANDHYTLITVKIPIPRVYISIPPPNDTRPAGLLRNRNWKFTWFGLIVFILSIWYAAETTTCAAFCHPLASNKNTWHPSDPFFPWAIPTKLDQWTGEVVSSTLTSIRDWYDPGRHKRRRRPKQTYSGYDWWGGRDGPTPLYTPTPTNGGAGSIADDQIWR